MDKNLVPIYTGFSCNKSPECMDIGHNGLVAFGAGHAVCVWNLQSNDSPKVLYCHKGRVTFVKWVHDNGQKETELVSSCNTRAGDVIVAFLDPDQPHFSRLIIPLQAHYILSADAVYTTSENRGTRKRGMLLAASVIDSTLNVWYRKNNEDSFSRIQTFKLDHLELCRSIRFEAYPDSNNLILVAAFHDRICLYEGGVGRPFTLMIDYLQGKFNHEIKCMDTTVSDDGHLMVVVGAGTEIFLWTFSPLVDSSGEYDETLVFEMGNQTFIAMREGTLKCTNYTVESIAWHPGNFSETGKKRAQPMLFLATYLSQPSSLFRLNKSEGVFEEAAHFETRDDSMGAISCKFDPNSQHVVFQSYHGRFIVCYLEDSQEIGTGVLPVTWRHVLTHGGQSDSVVDLQWEPAGMYLFTASRDRSVCIHAAKRIVRWPCTPEHAEKGFWSQVAWPQLHGYPIRCIAVLSSEMFASAGEEKIVRILVAPSDFMTSLIPLLDLGEGRYVPLPEGSDLREGTSCETETGGESAKDDGKYPEEQIKKPGILKRMTDHKERQAPVQESSLETGTYQTLELPILEHEEKKKQDKAKKGDMVEEPGPREGTSQKTERVMQNTKDEGKHPGERTSEKTGIDVKKTAVHKGKRDSEQGSSMEARTGQITGRSPGKGQDPKAGPSKKTGAIRKQIFTKKGDSEKGRRRETDMRSSTEGGAATLEEPSRRLVVRAPLPSPTGQTLDLPTPEHKEKKEQVEAGKVQVEEQDPKAGKKIDKKYAGVGEGKHPKECNQEKTGTVTKKVVAFDIVEDRPLRSDEYPYPHDVADLQTPRWRVERELVPHSHEGSKEETLWIERKKLYKHGNNISALAAHPDRRYLASANEATNVEPCPVVIWNTTSWTPVQTLLGHTKTVTSMAFSPDGKYFLTVSLDGSWYLSVQTEEQEGTLYKILRTRGGFLAHALTSCCWSHNSAYFSTGSRDGSVTIWERQEAGARPPSLRRFEKQSVSALAMPTIAGPYNVVAADLHVIAIGFDSGAICIFSWRPHTGIWSQMLEIDNILGHHLAVRRLGFQPTNPTILASCGDDKLVRIYNLYHVYMHNCLYRSEDKS